MNPLNASKYYPEIMNLAIFSMERVGVKHNELKNKFKRQFS